MPNICEFESHLGRSGSRLVHVEIQHGIGSRKTAGRYVSRKRFDARTVMHCGEIPLSQFYFI